MPNHYGAKQYKQMAVTTASRGQVLIMLYEAAIRNVRVATMCIKKGDIAGRGMAIGKTHDIINELLNTLNFEVGGQIARDLERLYNFIAEQLLNANLEASTEKLGIVQKLLSTLLEGWRKAVDKAE